MGSYCQVCVGGGGGRGSGERGGATARCVGGGEGECQGNGGGATVQPGVREGGAGEGQGGSCSQMQNLLSVDLQVDFLDLLIADRLADPACKPRAGS